MVTGQSHRVYEDWLVIFIPWSGEVPESSPGHLQEINGGKEHQGKLTNSSIKISYSSAAAPAGATAELLLSVTYSALVKTRYFDKSSGLDYGFCEIRP